MRSDNSGNKWCRKVTPSTEKKQARDSALRLVLERAGGRKTIVPKAAEQKAQIGVADWILEALPEADVTE